MLTPAPIDRDVVPYTKRAVLKYNAGLFVDGGKRSRRSRIVTASTPTENDYPCYGRRCTVAPDGWGWCDSKGNLSGSCPPPGCPRMIC